MTFALNVLGMTMTTPGESGQESKGSSLIERGWQERASPRNKVAVARILVESLSAPPAESQEDGR